MYTAISRAEGKPGDKRKHGTLTYEKSINGKWLIARDKAFRQLLEKMHVNDGKTLRAIGEETGIPHSTLQKALNDFGLMRSKKAKSAKLDAFVDRNIETLKCMYYDDMLAITQIVEIVNKKTKHVLQDHNLERAFKKRNLPVRSEIERSRNRVASGRQATIPRGQGVFNRVAIDSWNYHLDMNLSALTFDQYRRIVHRFTYMVVRRYPQMFPANARREDRAFSQIHLDHQFSRFSGYYKFDGEQYVKRKRPVPLEVICHPENLKLMPGRDNMQKSNRDHLSLPKLKSRIEAFTEKHHDLFADYYDRYSRDDIIKLHAENKRGK